MCYHQAVLTLLSSLAPWCFIDRGARRARGLLGVRECGGPGPFPSSRLGNECGDVGEGTWGSWKSEMAGNVPVRSNQ